MWYKILRNSHFGKWVEVKISVKIFTADTTWQEIRQQHNLFVNHYQKEVGCEQYCAANWYTNRLNLESAKPYFPPETSILTTARVMFEENLKPGIRVWRPTTGSHSNSDRTVRDYNIQAAPLYQRQHSYRPRTPSLCSQLLRNKQTPRWKRNEEHFLDQTDFDVVKQNGRMDSGVGIIKLTVCD